MSTRKRLAAGGDEQSQRDIASELRGKGCRGVICTRRRELESYWEPKDAGLHPGVRGFFEEVVRKALDQDIRVLAAAPGRERSERGRKS